MYSDVCGNMSANQKSYSLILFCDSLKLFITIDISLLCILIDDLNNGEDDDGRVYGRDGEGDSVPRGKNQWMCITDNCTERKQAW